MSGVAMFMPFRTLPLRGASCGGDDPAVFDQPGFFNNVQILIEVLPS
jgi:hypothetical protein